MRRDPTRRRVALFGNFGTGNLGNEATLQAMVYNLQSRLPNAEISCICPRPDRVKAEHKISAIPIRAPFPLWRLSDAARESEKGPKAKASRFNAATRLRVLLRICATPWLLEPYRWFRGIVNLKGYGDLVMTGTGMIGDYAIGPFDLHYDILRWAIIARLCRCRLQFASVGGGPIRHPLSRWFVRLALGLAHYRSYRDAVTKENLTAMGVDVTGDPVFPDLAFSLPEIILPPDRDTGRQRPIVGVGVMNHYGPTGRLGEDESIYRNYLGRLALFVGYLIERGYIVRILVGDVVWDQRPRQHLKRELERCNSTCEEDRVIDEPVSNFNDLLSQLATVDLVVASRYHNLILALMLGKPAVAVAYHEKFRPLMTGVGLGEFCQEIEDIDVDDLVQQVITLQERTKEIKVILADKIGKYRTELDDQYQRILYVS
jgi:polysaccharide pyruvyl transferase WcaK-like protein